MKLNRRVFFIMIVLIAVPITLTAKHTKRKSNICPAIFLQLYSLRDIIDADKEKIFAEIAAMGYAGVEAADYSEGKFYGMSPAEFNEKLKKAGLVALSSHAGYGLASEIDKTDWRTVWKWWDEAIAAHRDAGMKYIVTPSMPVPKSLKALKVYCDYYNTIGEKCNAAGLKFGYHNHEFEFGEIEGELMYDYMLKNTDPAKVFFQMDVYWTVYARKSPVVYFAKYPGRFELLHLKDYKELGQSGMVGFDAILNNRTTAGVKRLIVEVENYNYPPIESVKLSYDYLNNLLLRENQSK